MTRYTRDHRVAMLRRRVTGDGARHALATTLYQVIFEGLEFGPGDLATPEDREWIRGALAIPLQETVDLALDAIAWRIAELLDRGPEALGDRYDRSHGGDELGWD